MTIRRFAVIAPALLLAVGVLSFAPSIAPPPSGAPVVDLTPYNYEKQDYALCAVRCFATLYTQSTVPYFSHDQPRYATLVYNSDRAHPRPFVHMNVSPDPGYGQTPTEYRLQVKLNGSFVTFVNGEQTLRFAYPGAVTARIGGQWDALGTATGVYPMEVLVSALYADASLITNTIATKLVVVNESNAPTAAGWTLAGIQRLYPQPDGGALLTEGDGGAAYFAPAGAPLAADAFNRADENPLGGSWTSGPAGFGHLELVSNAIRGVSNTENFAYYNAVTWPNDQWSEVRIASLASGPDGGAAVRISATSKTAYVFVTYGTGTTFEVGKIVNGSYTQLASGSQTFAVGDVLRLEVEGTTLRAFKNGIPVTSVTDATISLGHAGMFVWDNNPGLTFDDWAGGIPASAFISPAGDFSKLIMSNLSGTDGWARLYPDSTKAVFDNTGRTVQLRDRFNNITTVTYDGSGRVWQVKDPLNLALTLGYGANGLSSIQDPGGRTTNVNVDASRRLTAITDPDNVSTTFVYPNLLLTKIVNRRGDTTVYNYGDPSLKLISLTMPPVPVFGAGTVSPSESHSPWHTVGVPYSSTGTTPASAPLADTVRARITDARSFTTVLQVDRFGAITRMDDPLGRVTKVTRDGNSLVVRDSSPSGGVDSMAYNSSGLPTYIQPAGLSAINMRYAAFGQPDSVWGTGRPTIRNFIGLNGRVDSTAIGGQSKAKYTYDAQGRVVTTNDPQGHLISKKTYAGTNGNLSADSLPGGRITTYLYDGLGRDTAVKMPQTALRRTHYDVLNRVTQFLDGVNSNPTVIAYDSLFPRSVTDPKSQVYQFAHNALGWMTQRTDPVGRSEYYLYDAVGDLKRWVNRRGDSLAYDYDALRRRTNKTGTNTSNESWTFSSDGLVITATSVVSTETAYFNVAGLPDSVKTAMAGQTYWRRYQHTAAGLLDSLDITGGGINFRSRKYVYNTGLGTLTTIRLGGKTTGIVANSDLQDTSLALPASDQLTRQPYPLHSTTQFSTGAGYNLTVARSVGFDSLGRISVQLTGDGSSGRRYTYDGLGRILSDSTVQNSSPPGSCDGNPPPTVDAYGNSCVNAGGWTAVSGKQFQYDGAGNRTDFGSGSYATGNRITGWGLCTYTSDNDGNLATASCPGQNLKTFTWTAESRLANITQSPLNVSYLYDAMGRLVRKDTSGVVVSYYLWDGASLLAELTSSGSVFYGQYSYYPGTLDRLHAYIDYNGSHFQAHLDAVGNVIALTDSAQTVKRTYEYDAWGQMPGGTDSWGFAGRDQVRWKGALNPGRGDGVSLYFMRNRWYWPFFGRFVSEDPLLLASVAPAPQSRFVWKAAGLRTEFARFGTGELGEGAWVDRREPALIGDRDCCFVHRGVLGSVVALPDNVQTVKQAFGHDAWGQYTAWTDVGLFAREGRRASAAHINATLDAVRQSPLGVDNEINGYLYVAQDPLNYRDPVGLFGPYCPPGMDRAMCLQRTIDSICSAGALYWLLRNVTGVGAAFCVGWAIGRQF